MRWIKVYDGLLEWGWHTRPEMVSLFIHLLLLANTRDREFEGVAIGRGELLASQSSLCDATGLSRQNIRTCLNNLESTGELTRRVTSKGTVITICKYEYYQAETQEANQVSNQPSNQSLTNGQPTPNQRLTTPLDLNNNNNNKDINNSCCCLNTQPSAPAGAPASGGFSFWSLPEEQQQREQQEFFEIFFFGNFRNVPGEVKRFLATNEGHRWMNKGKTECYSTPEQRRAIALLWQPSSGSRPRVPSTAFLAMWKDLHALAKKSDPDVAALMLDERVTVGETGDGRLFTTLHQRVWDWITDASRAAETRKIIDRFTKKTIYPKIIC